jgi:hypothetical protein
MDRQRATISLSTHVQILKANKLWINITQNLGSSVSTQGQNLIATSTECTASISIDFI